MSSLVHVVMLIVSLTVPVAVLAQTYPARPVRMLVGFAAGGGADALARIVAAKLSVSLGQQVVVDNRPGAGGTIAADALTKSAPDGYTIYFADTAVLIAPAMYEKVSYDPVKSFAPVGSVCTLPLAIVVNPSVPAKTTAELIRLLRANPGKYSYGTPGVGTLHQLAMELFKKEAGVDIVHIPYKGAAPSVTDLLGGVLPVAVVSLPVALVNAKADKLRVIAVTSATRHPSAPDWPPVSDTLRGFEASPWLFLIAPRDTPAPIVARLNEALKQALEQPDLLEAFAKQGATARWSTADTLESEIQSEVRKWDAVVRTSGAKGS